MKYLFRLLALLAAVSPLGVARAQTTTITASHIQSLAGQPLASGYFELTPVNSLLRPTAFTACGGGQILPTTFYWPIANGGISGVVVPDASCSTPSGIGYLVVIADQNKYPIYTYSQAIFPSGASWSFDTWSPTSTAQVTPAGAILYGTQAPTGRCTAPSIYYYGTGTVTQLNCVGGTWTSLAGGGGGGMVYPAAGVPCSTGSAWCVSSYPLSTFLQAANNLSDLASASAARSNLGLGTAAMQASSAFDAAGAAAAAQAAAQASSLQAANNLSDLANAGTARTNLGLGAAAVEPLSTFLQSANNLSDLASVATARTNLGLGSAATQASSAFDAAGAASAAQAASLQKVNNLSDVASAATSRTNLGLGAAATEPLSAFLQSANNLSDLASASTARTNLGANNASNLNTGTVPAAQIPAALSGSTSVNGTSIPASVTLTQTIASGTASLGTSAIASGACATVVTVSATGVASTDAIAWTPDTSIKAVTGYAPSTSGGLSIAAYPTAGDVNFDVCNWSSGSITPGAVTLNWRVTR